MQSKAKTVSEYLRDLSPDRRISISKVRVTILEHLPRGYVESMGYGMITYVVPLKLYPKGYLGQPTVPLTYVGLASQKNYMSLYLTNVYGDQKIKKWFEEAYETNGFKLNMGKSCIRFKRWDQLNLKVIGQAVRRTSARQFIQAYEATQQMKTNRRKSRGVVL